MNNSPVQQLAPACRDRERFRICEVPLKTRYFFHAMVLLMPSRPIRFSPAINAARLLRGDGSDGNRSCRSSHSIVAGRISQYNSFSSNRFAATWTIFQDTRNRPFPFVLRYLRQRLAAHLVILTAVVAAVACSVGTQYGVKYLVDGLSAGPARAGSVWLAFVLLMSLIAADNFLWRIASWTASFTFVGVTGDLRRDIFRHLTGHAPSYFSDRLPGMLTSRITATSNAVFTVENMFVWNVLPPCIATVAAIALIGTVSLPMAAGLIVIAGVMVVAMFHLAAAGKPLHDDFADKAAAVDGEMVDVINNMPLVRAFCGLRFEHDRFDATVNRELTARGRSLRYLEKLRLTHAAITVVLTIALLAWAIVLWQRGGATTGDVVLVCTLGLSILNATRDLAVALVDVTQHVARLTEAIATLLLPHELRDHPEAEPLVKAGAAIVFNNMSFRYPGGAAGVRQVQPPSQAGPAGRAGRTVRRRQIQPVRAAAAILRRGAGPHHDRRPGHLPGHPGEPARGDLGGAAGHLAVPSIDPGKYPLRTAERDRRRGAARGDRGALRFRRDPAAKGLPPWSATAASSCRAASASASRLRAPS